MEARVYAGAAQMDITPHLGAFLAGTFELRPAEDVDDPLFAKAVVLDDGTTRLAMVVLDVMAIARQEVARIRRLVADETGIAPECVMIACTHTHTAPDTLPGTEATRDEAYVDWLVRRVADTVRLAARRMQPARIGWGRGEQHDISFCRRFLMSDGTVQTNPRRTELARAGEPIIVRPTSPIDPTVGVLYIEDLQGRPLAVVAQFSLHYVGTDNPLAISADYYGHFARIMQRHLGDACIPLLFNGTSGQINNIDPLGPPHTTRGHAQARKVASALAGEVIQVIARTHLTTACPLDAASTTVSLPCKTITESDRAIAQAILTGGDLGPDAGPFSFVVGEPIPMDLRSFYAELVLTMPDDMTTEVQAFRIGQSSWVALPGETFVEIGLAIKKSAPVADTFVIGLANDSLDYIATDHALTDEGGYETWFPIGVGAEGVLVNASEALLHRLFGAGSTAATS